MASFNHAEEHVDPDMIVLQANLDDMNPEHSSYVMDRLFEAGANDVYWIPIIMKKGRPGMMLNVLVSETKLGQMEAIIFRETTTLGIRYQKCTVHRLGRVMEQVETIWGSVTVKAGIYEGEVVQFAPEFADCERIARQAGVPLKQVYEEVRRKYAEQQGAQ
ncbi:nickel insertion protein [Marinicrinis sediminis]|uniref:Nickel insertion protein n=1 Tax=Marinicrinis sediminis TaxID=1652465 RepID=A0ABW5R6S1_9BACL